MKYKFIILCICTYVVFVQNIDAQNNVAINSTGVGPDPSAILDVSSATLGLLIPRPTSTPTTPANGLMFFNSTTNSINVNTGASGTPIFYSLLSSNLSSPLIYTTGTGVGTSSGTLSIQAASISPGGYLISTDWDIFNGKQPYLNNSTLASTGFVQANTSAVGTTAISYLNTSLCNTTSSTGTAGYYPKYATTSTLSNSLIYEDASSHVGVGTITPNSTLQVNGSFATKVTPTTAAYLILTTDYLIIVANSLANTIVTLPDATKCTGRVYVIKDNSPNGTANGGKNPSIDIMCTIAAQTIDGVIYSGTGSSKYLSLVTRYDYLKVQSDGANWYIVSSLLI